MLQIQYSKNLRNTTNTSKTPTVTLSNEPFKVWNADEVKIDDKKYYLFVNKTTKLIILLDAFDAILLLQVLGIVVHSFDYLTHEQQHKLLQLFFNPKSKTRIEVVPNDAVDPTVQKIKKLIEKNGVPNTLQYAHDNSFVAKLAVKSLSACTLDNEFYAKFLTKIIHLSNSTFPIKANKPTKHYKYMDLKMKFDNFSNWENYEYKPLDGNEKVVTEIKANNAKLIKQFTSTYNNPFNAINIEPMLLDFLDEFLLHDQILFVTSNLGAVNTFVWLVYNNVDFSIKEKDNICMAFNNFYKFLSRTGLIKKSDAKKVEQNLIELSINLDSYIDAPDNADNEAADDLSNMMDPIDILHKLQINELTPKEQMILTALLKKINQVEADRTQNPSKQKNKVLTENKKRNKMTYEVRVKLRGFKPSTWRRFYISGDISIENFEVAILTMFNADMGHLYDLYSKSTDQHFERQNNLDDMDDDYREHSFDSLKNKLSIFKKGDKAILSYDYGDGWEFDVDIKNISDTKAPEFPQVVAGKGYGIIDDIGGVYSLQEYYDTPEKDMDPELLDWLGGEKIDLNEFDKDDINSQLEHM